MTGVDFLFFAQDAGAANFLAPLPALLARRGLSSLVLAAEPAATLFTGRQVGYEPSREGNSAGELLKRVRPRVVVVGTASDRRTPGLALVDACRTLRLPSVGVVDAAMNISSRFAGETSDSLAYAPDWILVPDQWVGDEFIRIGAKIEQVVATGNPHYDHVLGRAAELRLCDRRELRKRVFPDVPANRGVVLFAAEGSARTSPLPQDVLARYTFSGRGTRRGRTEIALEELLDSVRKITPPPYIVLRPHPRDGDSDYASYLPEIGEVSGTGSALEMMYAADLVVGTTSMLMTEAVLLGRPTLALVPLPEEMDWLPAVRDRIAPAATRRDQILPALRRALEDRDGASAEQMRAAFAGASERVASFLCDRLAGQDKDMRAAR